jgi:hypothetical protein
MFLPSLFGATMSLKSICCPKLYQKVNIFFFYNIKKNYYILIISFESKKKNKSILILKK